MATNTTGYDLSEMSTLDINKLVQCEMYATALSVQEMEDVAVSCAVPMVKMSWQIKDSAENTVKTGEYAFPEGGVSSFVLKDVVPLAELKAYETENADYQLTTAVTLISGHEVGGYFSFQCFLRTGSAATEAPTMDLRQRLAAIPVANSGMTEDQLRQICMDYMRLLTERFTTDMCG